MTVLEELVLAPAKINLFLRVIGRRPDGYHLIDSLMVPIDLCDELCIRVNQAEPLSDSDLAIRVTSDSPDAPGGPSNLAFRAAAAFLQATQIRAGIDISIRKRIPVGSGLGGGSSDAAAVLERLNQVLGRPLDRQNLVDLAALLGADVPFFLLGCPARVGGIGEVLQRVSLPHPYSLVICSDGRSLSTTEVYSRVDLALTSGRPASSITNFVSGRRPLPDLLVNDLEAAAMQIHPALPSLKRILMEHGAQGALMTGSGSAVFGVWPDPESADRAAKQLRERGLWSEAVQTLMESPTSTH